MPDTSDEVTIGAGFDGQIDEVLLSKADARNCL
jgi:hypothetical protein